MTTIAIPKELTAALRKAGHVCVLTGSGVSAESGVPTFREAQTGLWAQYDPTELATPEAFRNNPKLVWEWYQWRRNLVSSVNPNPGHLALVEFEKIVPRFTLVTQNVDGLHQQAGSREVLELHGSLRRAKCFDQQHVAPEYPENAAGEVPVCIQCGSLMRPDVVWFNEPLPTDLFQLAARASTNCDVFFSIGTSSVVQPAASLAFNAAQSGATVVEINPNETPLTPKATFVLHGAAGEVLPVLLEPLMAEPENAETP